MIFGLERFFPRFFASHPRGEQSGRRIRHTSVSKGIQSRKRLHRNGRRNARRVISRDSFNKDQEEMSTTNSNDKQKSKDRKRNLSSLKKTLKVERASNKNDSNRCARRKRTLAKKVPQLKNNTRAKGQRLRKQHQQKPKQRYRKRTSSRSEKRLYATEEPDEKILRVKKVKRFWPDTNGQEKRLKRPIWSPQTDRDHILNDNPISFDKCAERSANDTIDDPLNVQQLHSSYVKNLYGRPADVIKEDTSVPKRFRRKSSTSRRRKRLKLRARKPFKKRGKNQKKTKPKKRMSRRELMCLFQSRIGDKIKTRRQKK